MHVAALTRYPVKSVVGESPSAYRARNHELGAGVPACYAKIYTRPVRIREASAPAQP